MGKRENQDAKKERDIIEAEIEKFMGLHVNRDRFIPPEEFEQAFRKPPGFVRAKFGVDEYFKIWLRHNQSAPVELKEYAAKQIKKRYRASQSVEIIEMELQGKKRKTFVHRIETKERLAKLSEAIGGTQLALKIKESHEKSTEVTGDDATIEKIRKSYVYAAVGIFPKIQVIMQEMGLLNEHFRPLTSLTEIKVREKMALEDWRNQRKEYLASTYDLVREEEHIVEEYNLLEAKKMVFRNLKYADRINSQYMANGIITTLPQAGKEPKILNQAKLDLYAVTALAEGLRRLGKMGPEVAIQINNNNGSGGGQATTQGPHAISATARSYLASLSTMDNATLAAETEKMMKIAQMISRPPIVIDAEVEDENESNQPK